MSDAAREVRELSPGIVSDPERCSGAPTIAGRRLHAALVVDAIKGGSNRDEFCEDYDLTTEQIDAALSWDAAGRPL